jgi:hypothetical protein
LPTITTNDFAEATRLLRRAGEDQG